MCPEGDRDGIDLGQARRRAKELLRAARARDPGSLAGMRGDRTPRLADAQRAVANELGFASWPALVAHESPGPSDEPRERTRVVGVADLSYVPGRPVRVRVRHRAHRYDIDDMGSSVAIARHPPGWRETAERVVKAAGWNVNRDGVVSMTAVEGRDIDALVRRTAEVSLAVLEAILDLT
jgi:mRNA-degrading endonuclease toxin of MazEF toxin-antitoxin module